MSKSDAQRAMREAKYARLQADSRSRREAAQGGPPAPPARTPGSTKPQVAEAGPSPVASPAGAPAGLCGHRSISGRACTREAGHPEKNHRYG